MNSSMRRAAVAIVAIVSLGACGGGGESDATAQSTTSTTAAQSATNATTAQSTTSSTAQAGSIVPGAGILSERCRSYTAYASAVGLAMTAALDPAAAAQLEELKNMADIGDAPSEIRDDFAVLIDYAKKLGEALAKFPNQNGTFNPAAITAMMELSQSVDQNRLDEASKNIEVWVAANCTGY